MRQKCPNCGLVNFPDETSCKRCKSPLGLPLECHNVWRDGKRLVIGMSQHLLPERCLKCGSGDDVYKSLMEFTYTPLPAYFTILFKFTYWTEIDLYAFLCYSHLDFAKRQTFLILPHVFVAAGAFSILAGFMGDSFGLRMILLLGGGLILSLGIFFIRCTSESLKVVKRNRKYIWIKGVDQNLLAQLEDFATTKT